MVIWNVDSDIFTVIKLIHMQYSCTCPLHIQCCRSFNIVYQPGVSPCIITTAGNSFQILVAVASHLCLNLSNVLKLQGWNSFNVLQSFNSLQIQWPVIFKMSIQVNNYISAVIESQLFTIKRVCSDRFILIIPTYHWFIMVHVSNICAVHW